MPKCTAVLEAGDTPVEMCYCAQELMVTSESAVGASRACAFYGSPRCTLYRLFGENLRLAAVPEPLTWKKVREILNVAMSDEEQGNAYGESLRSRCRQAEQTLSTMSGQLAHEVDKGYRLATTVTELTAALRKYHAVLQRITRRDCERTRGCQLTCDLLGDDAIACRDCVFKEAEDLLASTSGL